MTLDELKRLRERLNDAGYAVIAETCRVLLNREIARMEPAPWTPEMGTQGTGTPPPSVIYERKTNQGGGGDASAGQPVDRVAVTGEASSSREQSGWTPDSAAAASFEERVARGHAHVVNEGLRLGSSHASIKDEIRRRLHAEDALAAKDAEYAEERAGLCRYLAAKDAEIARLKAAESALRDEFQAHSDKQRDEIARLKSEGVAELIRQRDEARREEAARAKTITRMGKDAETATKEFWEAKHEADRLSELLTKAHALTQEVTADRDALKAALDEEVKATIQSCADDAEAAAPKEGYGRTVALCIASRLRSRADAFDALRSASRAKEK